MLSTPLVRETLLGAQMQAQQLGQEPGKEFPGQVFVPTTLLSRSLYRSHVLSTFFGPVLGAMMKQVCWHSRRSEAHRGLPEARPRTQNVMARGKSEARIYIIHVKTE